MFEGFYGFSANPFQLNPDPAFYFESKGHGSAYAYLKYGVFQSEGFLVVTGEIGAGKTTLVRALLEELDPRKVVAVQLVSTQLEADDLLRAVAVAFGLPVKDAIESIGATFVPIGTGASERLVQATEALGGSVLFCTPSYAFYLAEKLAEAGTDPRSLRFRLITLGAEPGGGIPELRARLERLYGARVTEAYGNGDVLPAFAATWNTTSHPATALVTAASSVRSPSTCSTLRSSSQGYRDRVSDRTASPRSSSCRTIAPPRNPPPPVTRAFMARILVETSSRISCRPK